MARGKACRECGHSMVATSEDEQEKGTWVTYHCNRCGWDEKVFEGR